MAAVAPELVSEEYAPTVCAAKGHGGGGRHSDGYAVALVRNIHACWGTPGDLVPVCAGIAAWVRESALTVVVCHACGEHRELDEWAYVAKDFSSST